MSAATDPHARPVHELFELQAERTPEAVAVVFQDLQLTYAALNGRANQLAHYLQTRGVGPNVRVGVCLERSLDMLIGIIAILKAGGAYVPIDPGSPPNRARFIAEDAGFGLIVTETSLVSRLEGSRSTAICLDTVHLPDQTGNPLHLAGPGDAIYVIYTSGTTGRPKGTLLTHSNIACLLQAGRQVFHFRDTDVWTLFHSIAFDFSVWEMWGALLHGGKLVIVSSDDSRSPGRFRTLVVGEGVSVLCQTPSAFRQLIEADREAPVTDNSSLRYVFLGGEALVMSSLRPWFDRHGDLQPQVVNMYGTTETAVLTTWRPVSAADLGSGSMIGRPLPDMDIHILDASGQPVPAGVSGELFVGGSGVSQGYLNLPDLTRERFVRMAIDGRSTRTFYPYGGRRTIPG